MFNNIIMGQCISSTKVLAVEAVRRASEKAEEAKAYVESYHARRYHPVEQEDTTRRDTNIQSYDQPLEGTVIEGEDEIDKIFEDSIINENI